jgi:hypothetical protein
VQTYPELNATIPAERFTDKWVFTVPGGPNAGFVYLTVALLAATGPRMYRDVCQDVILIPMPRPDASASEGLYAFDALPDLDALAEAQGVSPTTDVEDLATDDWPEDESVEDFIAAIVEGRHEEDEPDF